MFTLLDSEEVRLKAFISRQHANPRLELEARIFPNIQGQDVMIDYYRFLAVQERFTVDEAKNGFGCKYEIQTILNVSSERYPEVRESVRGQEMVRKFWVSENIKDISTESISRITKKKGAAGNLAIDLANYPVRISLNEETKLEGNPQLLDGPADFVRFYRLQNRVAITTRDGLFRLDMTTVKEGSGRSIRQSNVLQSFPSYEMEIEYVGSSSADKEEVYKKLLQTIGLVMQIYLDTPILVMRSTEQQVIAAYSKLVDQKQRTFIAANPRTLHRENAVSSPVPNILRNYAVAYKADGMRMFLLTTEEGLFMIDSNFSVMAVGANTPDGWVGSLIEGEYVRTGRTFYAYDMLFAKGLDIRNKPLEVFHDGKNSSRQTYLKQFVEASSKEKAGATRIVAKPHMFGNGEEIFTRSKELWAARKTQPFHVDGLIYTPANDPYPKKSGTWDKLFKWKPPHLNTIDFLISIKKENNKEKIYAQVVVLDKTSTIVQYKILTLNVSGRGAHGKRSAIKFQEAKVRVSADGKILAKDPLSDIVQEVRDDMIVEFSYDPDSDFSWVPIRVRHEKTAQYRRFKSNFGNDERTAQDIWKSIKVPLTEEMITTGKVPKVSEASDVRYTSAESADKQRLPYQVFHTVFIKNNLLRQAALNPRDPARHSGFIIDFGSSRGGDLGRWKEIGFTVAVGIDLDPDSVAQATMRYEQMDTDQADFRASFICGDVTKPIFPNYESACLLSESKTDPIDWKDLMRVNIPSKHSFDVVSSQFVIHYAFETELKLRTYMQNVADVLRVGGYFVGTTFDGSRVYDSLKKRETISGSKGQEKIWEIRKLYGTKRFVENKNNFGMAIDVFVGTIGIAHKEYLVSYGFLEKLAAEYGLELIQKRSFAEYWEEGKTHPKLGPILMSMSEAEKQFSFLFSSFLFRKKTQAPESTYRKLVHLQRKAFKQSADQIEQIPEPVDE